MTNRTIKFRAWDEENKKMTIFDDYFLEPYYSQEDYILMQYTGLNDINGDEIYEGDIVEYYTYTGIGKLMVTWIPCMFVLKNNDNSVRFPFHAENCEKIQIIGNIFENTELMEENNV